MRRSKRTQLFRKKRDEQFGENCSVRDAFHFGRERCLESLRERRVGISRHPCGGDDFTQRTCAQPFCLVMLSALAQNAHSSTHARNVVPLHRWNWKIRHGQI